MKIVQLCVLDYDVERRSIIYSDGISRVEMDQV